MQFKKTLQGRNSKLIDKENYQNMIIIINNQINIYLLPCLLEEAVVSPGHVVVEAVGPQLEAAWQVPQLIQTT